jgi:hypothetical protein
MRAKRLCPGWEHSSVITSPMPSQNLSTIACLLSFSGSRLLSALSHTLRWYAECIVRAPRSPDATPVNDAVADIVGGCNSFALELMEWMGVLLPVPASPNTVISDCLPLASVRVGVHCGRCRVCDCVCLCVSAPARGLRARVCVVAESCHSSVLMGWGRVGSCTWVARSGVCVVAESCLHVGCTLGFVYGCRNV